MSNRRRTCMRVPPCCGVQWGAAARRRRTPMRRPSEFRTNCAILAVVGLAVLITGCSIRQARGPSFRPLTATDIGVLIAMLALVVMMDLVQVSLPQSKFSVAFTVAGTVFVAA